MLDLAPVNETLRSRGLRMLIEQRRQALVVRGTFPEDDGTRKRKRISLDLPAVPTSLVTAELRCLQLQEAITKGSYPPNLPWSTPVHTPAERPDAPLSCAAAIHAFETHYWQVRPRTPASERTWSRISLELRRLPTKAPCTLQQLLKTAAATPPGTRTRLECCKVFKRLAKHQGIPGNLEELSALKGNYEPADRTIPEDEAILALLDALRPTKWGWCYAALAAFGCRPAEVPSLVLHEDGTADCLTIKRRNRAPAKRTCFALPRAWIARFDIQNISIPGGTRWTQPDEYNSALGKKFVDSWRHSRRSQEIRPIIEAHLPEFDLYDLRHRWAIRSIEGGKRLTLCARAMGHSATVHEQTYHRHIQAADLRTAMATEAD
jgi:integrase